MMVPLYIQSAALPMLRHLYRAAPVPSVLLPAALDPAVASRWRGHLAAAGWTAFDTPTLGRYQFNESYVDAAAFDELRRLAEVICQLRLRQGSARWRRLGAGDYSGRPDDERRRTGSRYLELTLDFSVASCGAAEICYLEAGRPSFVLPQLAGSLALIERHPNLLLYERYLSHRLRDVDVQRLRLDLHFA